MNNSILALLVSIVISLIIGPVIIRMLSNLKVKQTISEDVPKRHLEKSGTPMMGGLIILIGAAVAMAVKWNPDFRVTPVLFFAIAVAFIGFADDILIAKRGKSLGLKARQKLFFQFAFATAFVAYVVACRIDNPTQVTIWGDLTVNLGWAYYPLAILMIVGMTNAFNLTDGLDGLASGLTAITAIAFGVIVAFLDKNYVIRFDNPLVVVCFALAGGCIGFLWYNSNPARIFMGDSGSLTLGGALAGVAVVERMEIIFLLVGFIFLIEALSVIIQVISFKSTGRRVFKMSPIHHHFELSGWPEQKIVVRFWILQVMIAVIVMALVGVFKP